jgi:hypothetical protein
MKGRMKPISLEEERVNSMFQFFLLKKESAISRMLWQVGFDLRLHLEYTGILIEKRKLQA